MRIEKYWHIILLLAAVIYSLILKSNLFDASVLCSGALCVALAAKGNILNYIIGMYNTLAYAYIAFQEHLYGEFSLYILFFVPTNIIGFIMWKRNISGQVISSRSLTSGQRIIIFLIVIFGTFIIAKILSYIPNQNNSYIDSYITVTSIVATILMMKRYNEQWILYILLNRVCIVLWIIRCFEGSQVALSMIAMWVIFLINACFGYYMWSTKLKKI